MKRSISPIDGRYSKATEVVGLYFSDFSIAKEKVEIETGLLAIAHNLAKLAK